MPREITITLTVSQARALSFAAGNIMDHEDCVESVFATGSQRSCAYRAYSKLNTALHQAHRPTKRVDNENQG